MRTENDIHKFSTFLPIQKKNRAITDKYTQPKHSVNTYLMLSIAFDVIVRHQEQNREEDEAKMKKNMRRIE